MTTALIYIIIIQVEREREKDLAMYHKSKLSNQEKIKAWLDLCNFTFKLLEDNLEKEEMIKRFKKMRQEHLYVNYSILKRMSKVN